MKKTSKWPIQDIEVADRWASGNKNLVLLGDAAHAMIPFMSIGKMLWLHHVDQGHAAHAPCNTGAAMAVEDASALAESLRMVSTKGELEEAVRIYEEVRQTRTRLVHESSYRHAYTVHLPDGPEQMARDAAMADEVAGVHFIQSPNQWSDPTTQRWAYGYDAAEAIQEAWDESRSPRLCDIDMDKTSVR